jgi:hypothetical protein
MTTVQVHGCIFSLSIINNAPTNALIFHSSIIVLPSTARGRGRGGLHGICRALHCSCLLAKNEWKQFTALSSLDLLTVASLARRDTLHSILHVKLPDWWPRFIPQDTALSTHLWWSSSYFSKRYPTHYRLLSGASIRCISDKQAFFCGQHPPGSLRYLSGGSRFKWT